MKEEPIKLLALITSNYRLYYQCKILSRKGYSGQQIAKTINVHPYRVKLALNQVKHYQLTHLLNIIDRCAETDYKLKSSYMDKQLILELFILSLYKKVQANRLNFLNDYLLEDINCDLMRSALFE